jgi:hypothetical protein
MATQTDPIVFAIANYRAASKRFFEHPLGDETDNLARLEMKAFESLARTEPTTNEGLLALLRYINECAPGETHQELLAIFTRAAEKILAR